MPNASGHLLLDDFRQSLEDCRQLYQQSAEHCLKYHPQLVGRPPLAFLELMDDLHRGLVVKIYFAVALVDHRWNKNERRLAQVLLEHAWERHLDGDELREAAEHLDDQSRSMTWFSLVRPFAEIRPLRERIADLETVILRMANIVARADGPPTSTELHYLATLREELDLHLRPITLDGDAATHEQSRERAKAAVETMEAEAKTVAHRGGSPSHKSPQAATASTTDGPAPRPLPELLEELDSLVGLKLVKDEIRTLSNLLKLHQHRAKLGLPSTSVSLHMVFAGNPGTGKTTVARLLAEIFRAMGILKKGHLVETDRSGLVAEYAGQTAVKTNQRIDEALEGVLFIDEAYSLVASEGDDPYGREALQGLLKRMEDDRDRLVVVLAGYPEPMRQLLRSNPGLTSRFNRTLNFEDYVPLELCQIFGRMCAMNHFELTPEVRVRLIAGFRYLYERRDAHFGNGRLVRNMFENAIRKLANRVATLPQVTHETLTRFQPQDIQFPQVPSDALPESLGGLRLSGTCPGCQAARTLPPSLLGRRVQCSGCEHRFSIQWAELVNWPPAD